MFYDANIRKVSPKFQRFNKNIVEWLEKSIRTLSSRFGISLFVSYSRRFGTCFRHLTISM